MITAKYLGSRLLKFLVENEYAESISDADQVGVVFGHFIDRIGLLLQEMFFQIISEVRIAAISSHLV